MENLLNLIFKDKQARIISRLRDESHEWYMSNLARETGTTYVHVSRFISRCEAIGIVGSEKHGNIKVIRLTERGKRIAGMMEEIYSLMNAKS